MLPISQLKMLVFVAVALIVLNTAKFCSAEADGGPEFGGETRHKRGPTVGLFAFPRVGRSDPADLLEWGDLVEQQQQQQQLAGDDYEDYPLRASLHEMAKRQGKLVAFPRVGRAGPNRYWTGSSSNSNLMQKRASGNAGANSAMWFGPRLGKRANVASAEIKGEQL